MVFYNLRSVLNPKYGIGRPNYRYIGANLQKRYEKFGRGYCVNLGLEFQIAVQEGLDIGI